MEKTTGCNTKAHRLAIQITEDIQRGKFSSGVLLPPDGELATNYDVSRITLRKSLALLSEKGQIHRLPYGGALAKNTHTRSSENSMNSTGGSSRTERKLAIAVVTASVPHYAATQRLKGTKRYADENNLKFSQFLVPTHEEALDILSRVEEYEMDGVIVTPFRDDRYFAALEALCEKKFPVVLENRLDKLPLSSVMSSDGVWAYHLTHYLIDKYRRPVYYLCASADSDLTPERNEGYINAMKDAGMEKYVESSICRLEISNNDPTYWPVGKNSLAGFNAADKLFSKIEFPASIFCENDFTAQGVYEAAKKHHLVVGQDVMVVGFDDYPLAKLIKPGLTTSHAFLADLGYEAGRLLHRLIKAEIQPPVHIRIPMEMVIRESA